MSTSGEVRRSGSTLSRQRRVPPGRYLWGAVLKFLLWALLRLHVGNAPLLPRRGPGIIYYNHIHWLDPAMICSSCARYAVPLAKIEARSWPVVGNLLRWYHVIFITRGTVDRDALRGVWQVLADGDISVISPEGTRSQDARLQAAKEGLAFVARHQPDAWLMPCAVTGTPQFSWSIKRIWKRPRVTLTYGQPFRFRWPAGDASRGDLREMTDEAMVQLAAALPPEMRGSYEQAPPASPRWLEFV